MMTLRGFWQCARGIMGSALVLLAIVGQARAATITFDPDGPGATNAPVLVGSFDWSPGNALAQGILPLAPGRTFQLHYHAALGNLVGTGGGPLATPGLNSAGGFEITAVFSITGTVTSVSGTSASFGIAPVQSPNSFVEMWFGAADANSLTGTGYNNGTRILLGSPTAGSATVLATTTPEQFDQFGVNNYPGVLTLPLVGGLSADFTVGLSDPAFFVTPVTAAEFDGSLTAAFRQTNPSGLFAALPGGAPPAVVPNVGVLNGVTGSDIQSESDQSTAFAPVPEPASILLAGTGVLTGAVALGWRRIRRRGSV